MSCLNQTSWTKQTEENHFLTYLISVIWPLFFFYTLLKIDLKDVSDIDSLIRSQSCRTNQTWTRCESWWKPNWTSEPFLHRFHQSDSTCHLPAPQRMNPTPLTRHTVGLNKSHWGKVINQTPQRILILVVLESKPQEQTSVNVWFYRT